MKIHVFTILLINLLIHKTLSESSEIQTGYEVTLAIPSEYTKGFLGRAFLIETEQTAPYFRAAISVEAANNGNYYSCSLDVFLGDVRVWSSGHLSKFYTSEKCVVELTEYGDLRLKGQRERVGWRSGTSGQGVKRLILLRTGNLVLVDDFNSIKWQSFNFPTDIMLWGQRLSSQTRLTSFPKVNSTLFYSMEIQNNKIALYLNFGKWKYSYWEYQPHGHQNITFVQLTSNGLDLFNGRHKFDQIKSIGPGPGPGPVRFLALDNSTGNLRLYQYSEEKEKFEASYQAINFTCDLPLACDQPYGICTSSGSCSCIRGLGPDCNKENFEGLCGKSEGEMVELQGVVSVLKSVVFRGNVGKKECVRLCLDDCNCLAVEYVENNEDGLGDCFVYRMVRGIKEVEKGRNNVTYMVKVPKGINNGEKYRNSGLKKWVIVVVGVVDGFIIFVVLGGLGYYFIWKRRKNLEDRGQAN